MNKTEPLSRDRIILSREISKRMTTINIGDLSQIEAFFGGIWGHGKDEDELTELEKEWRQIWELCRKAILDNGNNQIRLTLNTLTNYDIVQNKKVVAVGNYDANGKYKLVPHPFVVEENNNGKK